MFYAKSFQRYALNFDDYFNFFLVNEFLSISYTSFERIHKYSDVEEPKAIYIIAKISASRIIR